MILPAGSDLGSTDGDKRQNAPANHKKINVKIFIRGFHDDVRESKHRNDAIMEVYT